MPNYTLSLGLLLVPLVLFVVLALWGKLLFAKTAGYMAVIGTLITTAIALFIAYNFFYNNPTVQGTYSAITVFSYPWLVFTKDLAITIGIELDALSVMMIVVVNIVSLMVHLYSLWYMKGEERYVRFFAYLSLFCFSMVGLVLSGNIFQIYIFWELVGVSSFLLIGFYFQKPSAVAAAKKAFIVTRFADFIFLVGILVLGWQLQSFDVQLLITKAQALYQAGVLATTSWSVLAVALCCIFVGGAGKSAMFPLHIWLPDAMEGPTPVSALIHSATMVVAGVFLVAKLYGLYLLTPEVLGVIKNVGIISALIAALIACTQTEIKRILAYSTMSQIGFMLFALGIGGTAVNENAGYTASLFHLFTHAFFKSLLFLCAGAIIHAVHSNDITKMGGLAQKMPLTHISFLIATLAISGVPPLSGFFSKELLLTTAYHQQPLFFVIALVTSALTAFYMFRLYFLVFWHKNNEQHLHSQSNIFWQLPFVVLVLLTLITGWLPFNKWVALKNQTIDTTVHFPFVLLPITVSLIGILVAAWWYKKPTNVPLIVTQQLGSIYQIVYKKLLIDELYSYITHKIIFNIIGKLAAWIDSTLINGLANLTGSITMGASTVIKRVQNGFLQYYLLYFLAGIVLLVVVIFTGLY